VNCGSACAVGDSWAPRRRPDSNPSQKCSRRQRRIFGPLTGSGSGLRATVDRGAALDCGASGERDLDRTTASFVDGLGAAAATSGILTQQQARIFALLYLQLEPLSLDEIATALDQSKSNISINIRVLVEWHLVRRKPVAGSRKDHYVAATDFFRAMQEIFERRFRWTVRQVMTTVSETRETQSPRARGGKGERATVVRERLDALHGFFALIDGGIGAFLNGEPFPAEQLQSGSAPKSRRSRS
jgi:DNA-binding transcriptional regulator GbsR (MarR family)